ncbi:MAG: NPCBM/NEW2 domain-containing protein, partial [Clostridia bacterium]|nr:NPCBM/NEW2 domain-containing protein [Clostridia bacterium]
MAKKKINRSIVVLVSLLLCAIISLSVVDANMISAFAAETSNNKDMTYLSDLDYHSANMEASRPVIKDAVDANGTKMQVKIEGAWYTFDKGLFTHTSGKAANITVTYNLENLNYNYFTAYVGLNRSATKGDGVKFNVGTSEDGKTWTYMVVSPQLIKPQAEAEFISVDIRGAKWLQLWANRGGNNAHDHAVWADAKLTNSLDDGEAVKPLASYDTQIKAKVAKGADLDDKELELLILQREFVSRVGQYALKRFTTQSGESNADNKAVLEWLLKDLGSLREFMMGGTPFGGSYYNSLTVLSKLYKHYKDDLDDNRPLLYNKWVPDRTYGELYRTMMFSIALTHDKTIGSYLQASRVENQSDPLRRYAIYRYLYETERFVATRDAKGNATYETMNLFGSLKVEEMRWIMSNIIDDESIIWLNDYVQTRINASPKSAGNLHTPHSYVKYTDPNYNNPVFYAPENIEYFNNLFAVDDRENPGQKIGLWDTEYKIPGWDDEDGHTYTIKITQGTPTNKVQKVWMNFKNKFGTGSVCGGISKSGCNIRGARGIPANVI